MIGLVAVTRAGRRHADQLAGAWGDAKVYDGPAGEALPAAFAECSGVVAFLATGAVVRILGPLLTDKTSEPGVVCVDEAARYAIALIGGHEGGANVLARETAAVLDCEAVVTTASDVVGRTIADRIVEALDAVIDPASDTAEVVRALLDGDPVALHMDQLWPLPALPDNVVERSLGEAPCILISDRARDFPRPSIVIRPPSLVLGVGTSRGAAAGEVLGLVDESLAVQGLSPLSVTSVVSVDAKSSEPGLLAAAESRGWPITFFTPAELAAVGVPNPSEVVRAAVGTPSVAEAAATLAAGPGATLYPKRKSSMATVAIARRVPRGRLAIIGLGPGARDLMTPRAVAELQRASLVVGLDQYVAQVRDLLRPGTAILSTALGDEEARARSAVEAASKGLAVALIGSGDAGVYAMASPALEYAGDDIDVVVVPGVTALLAAAADIGGAPVGHDHCAISLSDLHTPWEVIERRVHAAAEGDFVIGFYNPRSAKRDWQLPKALAILAEHRPPTTPVAVVTNATRPTASALQTTLAELDVEQVGMYSMVLVGSSQSRYVAGRFITPRGYTWAP
ncbi:MAG: precorrin-3B C(17)-methyltransferase [Actinomycetota bacterium]